MADETKLEPTTEPATKPTTEPTSEPVEVSGGDSNQTLARLEAMPVLARSSGMTLRVRYVSPRPAPESGGDWPASVDWPGIEWAAVLPVGADGGLAREYRSGEGAWGEDLGGAWGRNVVGPNGCWLSAKDDGGRVKCGTVYAPTLEAGEKYLLEAFAVHAATVAGIAGKRNTRLAVRAERLRAACLRPGAVVTAAVSEEK